MTPSRQDGLIYPLCVWESISFEGRKMFSLQKLYGEFKQIKTARVINIFLFSVEHFNKFHFMNTLLNPIYFFLTLKRIFNSLPFPRGFLVAYYIKYRSFLLDLLNYLYLQFTHPASVIQKRPYMKKRSKTDKYTCMQLHQVHQKDPV